MKIKNQYTLEYKNKYFSIEKTINNMSNGEPYYRLNTNDSVICCILDLNGNIVYIKQYRPNLGYYTIELPSGYIEENETPSEAASRELLEETGLEADLIYLGSYRINMNRNTSKEFIYAGIQKKNIKYKNEPNIEVLSIPRCRLMSVGEEDSFEHIISYAIFQIINLKLKMDFLSEDFSKIKKIFKSSKYALIQ